MFSKCVTAHVFSRGIISLLAYVHPLAPFGLLGESAAAQHSRTLSPGALSLVQINNRCQINRVCAVLVGTHTAQQQRTRQTTGRSGAVLRLNCLLYIRATRVRISYSRRIASNCPITRGGPRSI